MTELRGYTDQLSYQAGDVIKLHISTDQVECPLEIVRLGLNEEKVWPPDGTRSPDFPKGQYELNIDESTGGACNWPVAIEIPVPVDWKTGYYRVNGPDVEDSSEIFFVVRNSDVDRSANILLVLCTNTYNAYNRRFIRASNGDALPASGNIYPLGDLYWHRVSFNRPLEKYYGAGVPVVEGLTEGASFYRWE